MSSYRERLRRADGRGTKATKRTKSTKQIWVFVIFVTLVIVVSRPAVRLSALGTLREPADTVAGVPALAKGKTQIECS